MRAARCVFTLQALGSWNPAGQPTAEVKPLELSVSFEAIDVDEGTAKMTTQFGTIPIVAKLTLSGLHLLSMAPEGAVYLTTIFNKRTTGDKLKAVHTRHEFTIVSLPSFTSRPEQYYGECSVTR